MLSTCILRDKTSWRLLNVAMARRISQAAGNLCFVESMLFPSLEADLAKTLVSICETRQCYLKINKLAHGKVGAALSQNWMSTC